MAQRFRPSAAVDIVANAASRVLSYRRPVARTPSTRPDPIEKALPRGRLRQGYVTLRTDAAWLVRDFRGEKRPVLVPRRGPSRYESRATPLKPRKLSVVSVTRETRDAVTVELAAANGVPLQFEAGQFLSLHFMIDGERVRRAYSLSRSPLDGPNLSITVKRIADGRASNYIVDQLEPGDTVEALGPSGNFVPHQGAEHFAMIAGGSGITPVISIAETVLRTKRDASVALLYGNRTRQDAIFYDRLASLEQRFGPRFEVRHVFGDALDDDELTAWLAEQSADSIYYLCGPTGLMEAARTKLTGFEIREEKFLSPAAAPNEAFQACTVRLQIGERRHLVPVAAGQTILEAGIAAGVALPFSCALGGCGACKSHLVSGDVAMEEPNCLTDTEREAGAVLTCSARPLPTTTGGPVHIRIGGSD